MDISLRQRLVDAALICPQRTAALQEQGDAFERQLSFRRREVWLKLEIHCVLVGLKISDHPRDCRSPTSAIVLLAGKKRIDILSRRITLNRIVYINHERTGLSRRRTQGPAQLFVSAASR